jgi:hypothetical protein
VSESEKEETEQKNIVIQPGGGGINPEIGSMLLLKKIRVGYCLKSLKIQKATNFNK